MYLIRSFVCYAVPLKTASCKKAKVTKKVAKRKPKKVTKKTAKKPATRSTKPKITL